MLNVSKIRQDFPILKRKIHGKPLVYLDNAATSQKPRQVIEAISKYYSNYNANIHRGVHTLAEEATEKYEKAREKIAQFIGATSSKEIIFVRNSTEAINLVAYSWGRHNLGKNDEIIISEMEHHSNIVPWQLIAKEKGAKIRYVKVSQEGYLDLEEFNKLLTRKTKLVSLVHISNVFGTINPIEKIGKMIKDTQAKLLVDGSQSVPRMATDVENLGCDFLVLTGHKMLGPTGIGVLYGKRELLEDMPPFLSGGNMIREVHAYSSTWNELPYKFEAGTPNIAGGIALGEAVSYLNSLGMSKVFEHEKMLTFYALTRLREISEVTIYGPASGKEKIGPVAFNIKDVHPHDVAQLLDREGIAVRSGHHCAMPIHKKLNILASCRASFYIYNTKEEIDKLVEGIEKVIKLFK